jgi:hypothetical protein
MSLPRPLVLFSSVLSIALALPGVAHAQPKGKTDKGKKAKSKKTLDPASSAKAVQAKVEKWLKSRTLKKLTKLVPTKQLFFKKVKGKLKPKAFEFQIKKVRRIYEDLFTAAVKSDLKKRFPEWLERLIAVQVHMGMPPLLKEFKVGKIVVHRDCATVHLRALGERVTSFYPDSQAKLRRALVKWGDHSLTWARIGKKWYWGVRIDASKKWVRYSLPGDPLRGVSKNFDVRELTPTAFQAKYEAFLRDLDLRKVKGMERRSAVIAHDKEVTEARVWDHGVLISVSANRRRAKIVIQLGGLEVTIVSAEEYLFGHYQSLPVGSVVLFRGRFVKADYRKLVLQPEAPDGEPAVRLSE